MSHVHIFQFASYLVTPLGPWYKAYPIYHPPYPICPPHTPFSLLCAATHMGVDYNFTNYDFREKNNKQGSLSKHNLTRGVNFRLFFVLITVGEIVVKPHINYVLVSTMRPICVNALPPSTHQSNSLHARRPRVRNKLKRRLARPPVRKDPRDVKGPPI